MSSGRWKRKGTGKSNPLERAVFAMYDGEGGAKGKDSNQKRFGPV